MTLTRTDHLAFRRAFIFLMLPACALLLPAALLLPTCAVAAQNKAMPTTTSAMGSLTVANKRYDAGKELTRMTKRYGLTGEQRAEIMPILVEQQKQVHTLGEDANLSETEWNRDVGKVHQQAVSRIKPMLTDAQLTKFVKDEAKMAKQDGSSDDMRDGPPDGPPPGGGPGGGGPPPGD